MALLNANYLGLYAFADSGQTTAYRVTANDTLATAETNFLAAAADGDYGLLVKSTSDDIHERSNLPAIVKDNAGSIADATTELKLLAAATSTTLDMNNTIDEIVARSAQCSSETYVIGGAQSWSLSADGLVQDVIESSQSGATALMDIARGSEYVLVRFVVDVTKKDTEGTQENYVNYIGQGIIENVSITGGFDDTATYSVSIRGYGKLYRYNNAS
jgi:predicted secreted protein